jgi:predicted DNA binding CopG/RHH family protein
MSIKKYKLNQEEIEVENALENGEYKSVKNLEAELKRYQKIASSHGNKDKRVNLRMTSWDYEKAQEKALMEGLPYQTLLSSILHKYLSGQLTDRHDRQAG